MATSERVSVRIPIALSKKLDAYIKELRLESSSQAIEVFLISFLVNEKDYTNVSDPILFEDKMVIKTFCVSKKVAAQIREIAKGRKTSIGECIRLAIYYGLKP